MNECVLYTHTHINLCHIPEWKWINPSGIIISVVNDRCWIQYSIHIFLIFFFLPQDCTTTNVAIFFVFLASIIKTKKSLAFHGFPYRWMDWLRDREFNGTLRPRGKQVGGHRQHGSCSLLFWLLRAPRCVAISLLKQTLGYNPKTLKWIYHPDKICVSF